MKKMIRGLALLACLLLLSVMIGDTKANAASNITTVSATGSTQGVTVSGTTDEDVAAVLIEVLEGKDIVTLETHAVTGGKFNATLSCALTAGKSYKVYVINYNGSGTTQETTVTFEAAVESVALDKTTATISTTGGTVQLNAVITPADASNQAVSWKSANAAVATVDNNGLVTAVGNGETVITVTTEDGGKQATATIIVNISTGGSGSSGGGSSSGGSGSIGGSGSSGGSIGGSESSGGSIGGSSGGSGSIGGSESSGGGGSTGETEDTTVIPIAGKADWKDVFQQIQELDEGATLTVSLKKNVKLSKEILKEIAEKDLGIVLEQKNGISWTINGKDVKDPEKLAKDINMKVTLRLEEDNTIPRRLIKSTAGKNSYHKLSLAHEGAFPFDATLSMKLEEQNVGKYANLFYFNEEMGELEFVGAAKVQKDGMVDLVFSHASEYLIVMSDESMKPEDTKEEPENTKGEPEDTKEKPEEPTEPVAEPVLKEGYTIQLGAFSKKESTTGWMAKGKRLGFTMYVEESKGLYRVQTELFATRKEAQQAESKLKDAGIKTFIVKVKRWVTEETSADATEPAAPSKPETSKPSKPETATNTDSQTAAGKSIETVAKEVLAGKWGNGAERKERLTKAGYDYKEVQRKVNELLG